MEVNDEIFSEILLELRCIAKLNGERIAIDNDIRRAFFQMADYLKEHQSIIDFTLKDINKKNEKAMREISSLYNKIATLSNPYFSDLTRVNTKICSNDFEPVYVLNKSLQINMAEYSLNPAQPNDAAYYRVGFYSNLPTSYTSIDEGYPTLVVTAQILRAVSTSANDTSGGTGVLLIARAAGVANNSTTDFNFPIPIKIPKSSLASVIGIAKNPSNEATTSFMLYTKTG